MPAATIVNEISNVQNTDQTAQNLTLMGSIVSGNTLVAFQGADSSGAITWDNSTAGTWAQLDDVIVGSARFEVRAKIADGTEDNKVLANTTGTNQKSAYYVAQILSDGLIGGVSISAEANGTSTAPNSASLTPGGGSANRLWLTIYLANQGGSSGQPSSDPGGYPTNYDNDNDFISNVSTGGITMAWGYDVVETATENPGAFDINNSEDWSAFTLAFEESPLIFTTDQATYEPGDDIVCTLTGYSGTPTVATLNSHTITIQGGGSSSEITITAPALSLFVNAALYADTRWAINQVLQINDPSSGNATTNIQIVSPTPKNSAEDDNWFVISDGTTSATDSDSFCPAAVASGDDLFFQQTTGSTDIDDFNVKGIVTLNAVGGEGSLRYFDVNLTTWSTITTHPFTAGAYGRLVGLNALVGNTVMVGNGIVG